VKNPRAKTWRKLTPDQVEAVDWILRVMHASTAIRGRGLEVIQELHAELREECASRVAKQKEERKVRRCDQNS
jgi:hypothetical protein